MDEQSFPERIKDRVQTWLMEDKWSLRKVTIADSLWAFAAEDTLGRKIVVGQKPDREDELIIQGSINIGSELANKLENLPQIEMDELLWDIRFELLRTNLEFDGIESPLERIGVNERLFFDALTKDEFLKRASDVRKGVLIVLRMLARKFAQQPPKKQLGFQR